MHNHLSACCAHEVETGSAESAQALTRKKNNSSSCYILGSNPCLPDLQSSELADWPGIPISSCMLYIACNNVRDILYNIDIITSIVKLIVHGRVGKLV